MELKKFERVHVESDAALSEALEELSRVDLVAIDAETTALDPRKGRLRLIQIASDRLNKTFLIDCFRLTSFDPLRRYMLDPRTAKLCYNGQFDCEWFMHSFGAYIENPLDIYYGVLLLKRYWKPSGTHVKLMPYFKDQLVVPGLLKLDSVLRLSTGIEISKDLQLSDWSGELTPAQYDYAASDVECLFPLADRVAEEIIEEGLDEAWHVENQCQMVTAGMRYHGILADPARVSKIGDEIRAKMRVIESRISAYPEFRRKQQDVWDRHAGNFTTINLNSDPEVCEALTRRWKRPIVSTKAAELKQLYKLDPELVELLTDYASLRTMLSTHSVGLLKFIHGVTGRIHSDLEQNGSPQQRYRSRKPQVLNIPRKDTYGSKVLNKDSIMYSENNFRDMFVAAPGCVFVKTDYAALQLLGVAQESGDPVMIKILNSDDPDLHSTTARSIYNLPDDAAVDTAPRQAAKQVNYAVSFRCNAETLQRTLAKTLGLAFTLEQCQVFIDRHLNKYRGVPAYHRSQPIKVIREGKVAVRGGRATLLKSGMQPRDVTTESINFVMALLEQSGIKKALGRLGRAFWQMSLEYGAIIRIVLSPYDEILVECEERFAGVVARMVEDEMVRSMADYIWKVPVKAESQVCYAWGGGGRPAEPEPVGQADLFAGVPEIAPSSGRKIMFAED